MLIFLTEKNGEAPCAYFSYVLNFLEVQRVHVLIFHVLIKKSVVYIIRDLGLVGYTPIYISLHLGKSVFC